MLKQIATLALLVLSMAWYAAGQATPDCAPGKLADYEHLGAQGCTIGHARFFNFHYHKTPNGLPASAISVTPGTTPNSGDPGLLLEAHWHTPLQQGSFISYRVDVPAVAGPLIGATLEMEFGQITGTGEATVVTEICSAEAASGKCGAGALALHVILSARAGRKVSDHRGLQNPLRSFRVINTPSLTTGRNGSASMNGFMMVFHFQAAPPTAGTVNH